VSDGFLSRWSRRKQALARGEEVVEAPPAPEPVAPPAPVAETVPMLAEAPPAPEPEPELDLSSLPDLDTFDATTDIRAFFQKGVPEALRNAALRKAYATDPVISTYMGPLDYAWDFNTPGGLPFGFASELGEVGEKLRQLIAQAVGEPPPPPEAESDIAPGAVLAEATPEALASLETGAAVEAEEDAPPPIAVRLADAEALPAALAVPDESEPPPPPRRRHGGALPA
jgi:hypothetical protein